MYKSKKDKVQQSVDEVVEYTALTNETPFIATRYINLVKGESIKLNGYEAEVLLKAKKVKVA